MAPQKIVQSVEWNRLAFNVKPNKDSLDCSNYSPVSLLNLDLKLFANHLRPLLHQLIGPEQIGFMPGRQARDNVTKALNLIHKTQTVDFEGMSNGESLQSCIVGLYSCYTYTHWIETTHVTMDSDPVS